MSPIIRRAAYVFCLSAFIVSPLQAYSSSPPENSAGEIIDESVLTTKVKEALIKDPLTRAAGFSVQTHKGLVRLSGYASSDEQRVRAVKLALYVPGVTAVRNDILIESEQVDQ